MSKDIFLTLAFRASNKTTIALALSLGLSMLINFIFVVLKFYRGKRNYSVDLDRTNFALR